MPILLICILLLVLNPYTIVGPLGYYVALPFLSWVVICGMKIFDKNIYFCFFICFGISVVGVFSSILHDIAQFEHLKVTISIAIYYSIGISLFTVFGRKIDIDDFLLAALYVGVLNGVVILLQVQFPQFRAIVESVFVESGNIDWTEGFRYRGLASGGGASLSVFSACIVYICLYLYSIDKIKTLTTFVSMVVLVVSVFFIGRTGVLLMVVAFFLYTLAQGWRNVKIIVFSASTVIFIFLFGVDYIKAFLINQYGEDFYRYSLGFFLEGKQGFDDEGTVEVIASFLTTVPTNFPEILIGYGFYGGSDFTPWTDSGYARMFLSVGFLFGIIFYGCVFYIFKKSAYGNGSIFWPLIVLLAIAETKEGLMFAGYSSRLIFILMGFFAAQKMHGQRQEKRGILNEAIPQ